MRRCGAFTIGLATLFAAAIFFLTPSCGGSKSAASQNISASQAEAISQQVVITVQAALTSALASGPSEGEQAHPSLAEVISETKLSQPSGCAVNPSGESCNIPVSYSGGCPQGGTIGVTGDFIFSLDSSGDGSDNSTLTITPSNCAVSNLTINGDPSISIATHFGFKSDALVYPITFVETGGITYGPNPAGSCSTNVTLTVSSPTSCAVSGTVCGHTLGGSC